MCLVNVCSGKGEFGEVLLSKAKGIEESEVEVVVLVKSLQSRDEQLQSNFRREAEMFAKLNHPNVVRLLGLCREAEPHYMILEYYDLVHTQELKQRNKHVSVSLFYTVFAFFLMTGRFEAVPENFQKQRRQDEVSANQHQDKSKS